MAALDIEIGFARPDEVQAIAALSRDQVEAGLGWGYRPRRIAELLHDPETIVLRARMRRRAVGFAIMRFGDERAHLILLAVEPESQRRGIGRRMVEWLLESARVAGMTSVHVELRATNTRAFAFYRALGFAETFRVPGYYRGRETAVRMIRMLGRPTSIPG
jgi:ribosomal-protein-alanine N-acetyltransferase